MWSKLAWFEDSGRGERFEEPKKGAVVHNIYFGVRRRVGCRSFRDDPSAFTKTCESHHGKWIGTVRSLPTVFTSFESCFLTMLFCFFAGELIVLNDVHLFPMSGSMSEGFQYERKVFDFEFEFWSSVVRGLEGARLPRFLLARVLMNVSLSLENTVLKSLPSAVNFCVTEGKHWQNILFIMSPPFSFICASKYVWCQPLPLLQECNTQK